MLDIEALLAPIPGDLPQGADPREDHSPGAPFRQMQEARRAARAAERGPLSGKDRAPDIPDWGAVVELAAGVLSRQGKDVEAAAALMEGWNQALAEILAEVSSDLRAGLPKEVFENQLHE